GVGRYEQRLHARDSSGGPSPAFTRRTIARDKLRPAFRPPGDVPEQGGRVERIAQRLTAEFIGTLALIFIGAGSVVILNAQGAPGLVGIALAHGLVLAIMVSVTGHLSGGHINPAVTISAWV